MWILSVVTEKKTLSNSLGSNMQKFLSHRNAEDGSTHKHDRMDQNMSYRDQYKKKLKQKAKSYLRTWQIEQDERKDMGICTFNVQDMKLNTEYVKQMLNIVDILFMQELWLYAETSEVGDSKNDCVYPAKYVDDNDDPGFNMI